MAFAISLKAANSTAEPVRALWEQVALLEAASSMRGLNYPPHITLALYEDIDPALLKAAIADAFAGASALSLTFARVNYFDTDPPVLWADPSAHSGLTSAHRAVHARIDPQRCHPHYRPGVWVPHCTLGTKIKADRRAEAVRFAARPIQPFRVTFDVADCVSFPPVLVLEEQRLVRPASGDPARS